MFNKNSFLVQLYAKKINSNEITIEDVPELFNLREVIKSVINPQSGDEE